MEGMHAAPRPERDLESQAHRETSEAAAHAEMLAALTRTLTGEELQAFNAIGAPGISVEERKARKQAFNALKAGTPDAEESLAERAYEDVEINLAGTILSVSRDRYGVFSVS